MSIIHSNPVSPPLISLSPKVAPPIMDDDMDIDVSSSASTASVMSVDCSDCETALTHSCELATCLDHSWTETTNNELDRLRGHVEHELSLGEHIPLLFVRPQSADFMPLSTWLSDVWGPFPLHTHRAACIAKDICSVLLVLHRLRYSYGPTLLENVLLDRHYRVHVLLEQPPRVSPPRCRLAMEEDMFHVGELLYTMLTGKQIQLGQENQLVPLGQMPYPVDVDGLKLAARLLSSLPKYRPTAGEVCFSWWPMNKPLDTRVITFML